MGNDKATGERSLVSVYNVVQILDHSGMWRVEWKMILILGDKVHNADHPCLIAFVVNFQWTQDFDNGYETMHVVDPPVIFVESGALHTEEY